MNKWKRIVTGNRKRKDGSETPGRVRWRRRVRVNGHKLAQVKHA